MALGIAPAVAAPAAEPEPVRFSYAAGPGCPAEDEFLFAVSLDGGLVARSDAASVRTFSVTLVQSASVVEGHLVVHGTDGREAVRAIAGARCEDVAHSLAVLMALALEPRPGSPPALRGAPPPPVERAAPPSPAAETTPPIERWRVGLSAAGTLGTGVGPGVLAQIAFYAEVAHDAVGPFAPSLRLGYETTATSTSNVGGVPQVSFSRRVGRLDACPFRFAARSDWTRSVVSADVCARLDVGVLEVGPSISPPFAWVAPGGLLRIRSTFPPFFLDLEGGAVVPLVRERFYFEPNSEAFVVPPVAAVGGVGLGGYFL